MFLIKLNESGKEMCNRGTMLFIVATKVRDV